MTITSRTLFVLAFAFVGVSTAAACGCVDAGGVSEQIRSADALFVGRIVAIELETLKFEGHEVNHMIATFEVARRWKGPRRKKVRVGTCGTQAQICTCGANFQLGESYLVAAEGLPLVTGSCNLTTELFGAEDLIKQIDSLTRNTR